MCCRCSPQVIANGSGRTTGLACLVGMQMKTSFIQQFAFALVASMAVAASAMSVGCGDNQYIAEGEHYQYVVSDILFEVTVAMRLPTR